MHRLPTLIVVAALTASVACSKSPTGNNKVKDFDLGVKTKPLIVAANALGIDTVTVQRNNLSIGSITISATVSSSDLSCGLSTSSIGAASTEAEFDCSSMVPGNYTMTINGVSGSATASITFAVQIT
jgi:hypothetical protein